MKRPADNPQSPKPATGSTTIKITLPNDLLAVMDHAAAADNRSRSNFIAQFLRLLKATNPFLGEPGPACDKTLSPKIAKGPPGPCPRGHIRPCERKQQPPAGR